MRCTSAICVRKDSLNLMGKSTGNQYGGLSRGSDDDDRGALSATCLRCSMERYFYPHRKGIHL